MLGIFFLLNDCKLKRLPTPASNNRWIYPNCKLVFTSQFSSRWKPLSCWRGLQSLSSISANNYFICLCYIRNGQGFPIQQASAASMNLWEAKSISILFLDMLIWYSFIKITYTCGKLTYIIPLSITTSVTWVIADMGKDFLWCSNHLRLSWTCHVWELWSDKQW